MATYTTGTSLLSDIMPQLKQYRATTGRDMSSSVIEGLLRAKLKEDQAFAAEARRLDLQETNQDRAYELQKQQAEDAASAARVGGATQILGTAAQGYTAYKIAEKAGLLGKAAKTAEVAKGAQGAADVAGASTAVGAQAALAAPTSEIAALEAFYGTDAATAAATSGAGASTPGLLGTVTPYLAPVGAGLLGSSLLGPTLDKILPGGGKTGKIVGGFAGGAMAGAAIGSVVPGIGTIIGGAIGGVVGGISSAVGSVVCSELLRQGKITEMDRKLAVMFRFNYIDDDMYNAYLVWARPYVEIMKRGGTGNDALQERMMAFVQYMIKKSKGEKPTEYEIEVYKEIYSECLVIRQEMMEAA